MIRLPIPAVPDLARAKGTTRDELITWFFTYYGEGGASWNYRSETRSIKSGYRGFFFVENQVIKLYFLQPRKEQPIF